MTQITVQDTMAELTTLSDRISTQVRWFAGGVVALLWGLLVTPPAGIRVSSAGLIAVGLLAVSVLFADFLQYSCGFMAVRRTHNTLLRVPDHVLSGYDTGDPRYVARTIFFWGKQILAVLTFLGLLAVLLPGLLR